MVSGISVKHDDDEGMLPADRLLCRARLHVQVGGVNQFRQSHRVDLSFRFELDVTHELAAAFQQAIRVVEFRTLEESHINMCSECVDVGERSVGYTGSRMTVVQ